MSLLKSIISAEFFFSVIRLTTPILFAALAALVTQRAGVMNIGLEGIMLISAFCGVLGSAYTQSIWIGILSAVVSGVVTAGIMAAFVFKLKSDLILTGFALNMFASGGTLYLMYVLCKDKATTASLPSLQVPNIAIPVIKDIPIIGQVFSGHNLLTYLSYVFVIVIWVLIFKSPLGLRIRAVGEQQNAAKSVGINVVGIQFTALLLSGLLASMGGAYMSMGYMSFFSRDMLAGRGFIALAAMNMGGARPLGTMFASLAFGVADALSNYLQTLRVPAEFIQMMPYIITIIGLVVYASVQQKRKQPQKILEKGERARQNRSR